MLIPPQLPPNALAQALGQAPVIRPNDLRTPVRGPAGMAPVVPEDDALTPAGVISPTEMRGLGKALQNFSDALSTPGGAKMLAQLGIAIGGPESIGGRLGQAAVQTIDANQEREALARVLAGEDPSRVFSSVSSQAMSPEAQQRVLAAQTQQQEMGLRERQVAVQEGQLGEQVRRTDLAYDEFASNERFRDLELGLAEKRIGIDEARLELDQWLGEMGLEENEKDRQLRRYLGELQYRAAVNSASISAGNAETNRQMAILGLQNDVINSQYEAKSALEARMAQLDLMEEMNVPVPMEQKATLQTQLNTLNQRIDQYQADFNAGLREVIGMEFSGAGSAGSGSGSSLPEFSSRREAVASGAPRFVVNGQTWERSGDQIRRVE